MPQSPESAPSLPPATPLKYSRDTKRLYCRGVDFNDPVDSIKDGFYPILENVRSYTDGVIQPRQGLTAINTVVTGQTPVHSIRRLNNKLNNTYTRLIGAGTKLGIGQTAFSNVQYNGSDVALSGNPLAMVPWRPDQSPASWMYIADSSAMYKVTYDGATVTTHKIGVVPPVTAPVVELVTPQLQGDGFPFAYGSIFPSTTHWGNDGTVAGAVSYANRVGALSLTAVLYDSGTTGWCSVVPSSMANLGPGTILPCVESPGPTSTFNMIWEVYRAGSTTGNSVARIIYDTDPMNTGPCTIVPAGSIEELKRNCVVLLNGGSNYFRVTEVITGPDNTIVAFKCNTGATTITAGQSLSVVNSFRTYTLFNLQGTSAVDEIKATFAPSGANLIGYLTYFPGSSMDLTYASNINFLTKTAISDLDYMHFSFKCADLAQIVQIRVMFDVDDASFTKNYYYRAITPSDLVAASKATQTLLDAKNKQVQNRILSGGGRVQRGDVNGILQDSGQFLSDNNIGNSSDFSASGGDLGSPDSPDNGVLGNPRDQTGTGDSQWSEIRFRRGDCVRVGTDWSKGWQAVSCIKFEVSMISGGVATLMEFSSLNIFGGGALDIGDIGAPYIYRYRYRCSKTGAASNWSPATRSGVIPQRAQNTVTCTPSGAPEVDLIDIQRVGGLVSVWATVGTVANSSGVFIDKTSDDFAQAAIPDSVGQVNYQPWISAQTPKIGTASVVAGTLIKDSGTSFGSWILGTGIKVGGINTTVRRIISSSILEVEESVGQGTNIAWEVPEPFIQTYLPCFWATMDGWFFACGDPSNPGRLYFSNQNNPDTTGGPSTPDAIANNQGESWVDVTSPSEPLQNGFVYNGRNYVFSTERLYEIVEIAPGQFIARETPTGKGLLYRWAFGVGSRVWFLSKDGVYETDGGLSRCLSFDQLYPFFPKEGVVGNAVNGFNPPNMTTGNLTISGVTADVSTFFRLACYDDFLYFIYPDTSNAIRCLSYQLGNVSLSVPGTTPGYIQTGWYPDVFNPGGNHTGIFSMYGEEGDGVHSLLLGGAEATTGKLYKYGGSDDAGTAIPWHVRQPSLDYGDRRADKLFADFIIDADAGGGTINVAAGINNYGSTLTLSPATTITGSGRVQTTFDISSGNGAEGRNIALDLSGTGAGAKLYLVETSFTLRPENSLLRATQYDDAGYEGEKFFQGIEIEADTQNGVRTIEVQYDGGQLADTLMVQHNGRLQKSYSFSSAFTAHLARLIPTDSNLWKLFRWKWIWEPEPPLVTTWETQPTSHGHVGYIHLRAIWISHTSTADLTLTITRMEDNLTKTFTIPNSGGIRNKETYLILGPPEFCKGKTFKYKITQAGNVPFRIYQRGCGVLVKPWGSAQAYARWVGWGGDHGDGVAQI